MKQRLLPTLVALFAVALAATLVEPRFLGARVLFDLLSDGAVLGIAAAGSALVLIAGGIDLSVGSLAALASTLFAWLVERGHVAPLTAAFVVLAVGFVFGLGAGLVIDVFALPAFLVTLAAMFLYRGLALLVSEEGIAISDRSVVDLASSSIQLLGGTLRPAAFAWIGVVVLMSVALRKSQRMRALYALGGDEHAARLAGVDVRGTRVFTYGLAGACSALAGLVYCLVACAGSSIACAGLELDAIAAAVIGGVALAGGVGGAFGTALGVLVFGILQVMILFTGSLDAAWTRVAFGGLLLVFLVLRHVLEPAASRARST